MAWECKLCKFGDGVCVQGFRKQHERKDPNCRLHGVTDRGTRKLASADSRPKQSAEKGAPSGQPTGEAARHLRPLAELTQFRTRKGNLILYEPESKDTWIGKEVFEDDDTGGYRDGKTGKPLSKRLAASYLAYRRRHSTRCSTGDKVDKYLHLVDKYQPQVSVEARIYGAASPDPPPPPSTPMVTPPYGPYYGAFPPPPPVVRVVVCVGCLTPAHPPVVWWWVLGLTPRPLPPCTVVWCGGGLWVSGLVFNPFPLPVVWWWVLGLGFAPPRPLWCGWWGLGFRCFYERV